MSMPSKPDWTVEDSSGKHIGDSGRNRVDPIFSTCMVYCSICDDYICRSRYGILDMPHAIQKDEPSAV